MDHPTWGQCDRQIYFTSVYRDRIVRRIWSGQSCSRIKGRTRTRESKIEPRILIELDDLKGRLWTIRTALRKIKRTGELVRQDTHPFPIDEYEARDEVPRRFQWYIAEGMLSLPTAKWSMVISFFSGVMASSFAFGCAKDTVEFFNAGIGEVRFPVGEGFLLVIFDYVGPWV